MDSAAARKMVERRIEHSAVRGASRYRRSRQPSIHLRDSASMRVRSFGICIVLLRNGLIRIDPDCRRPARPDLVRRNSRARPTGETPRALARFA